MFRAYQVPLKVDPRPPPLYDSGTGTITVQQPNTAVEWDIYQMTLTTRIYNGTCSAAIYVNGNLNCATPQGSVDTASGPPDIVIRSTDTLQVFWYNGTDGDTATLNIWYNEVPAGSTISMAH